MFEYFPEKKKKQGRKVYIIQHRKRNNLGLKMMMMVIITAMIDVIEIGAEMMIEETEIDIETEVIEVKEVKEIGGETRRDEIGIQTETALVEVITSQDLKMNLEHQGMLRFNYSYLNINYYYECISIIIYFFVYFISTLNIL